MANITAALVKELREKTGAGMMDCKNALNETNGDIEAAVDWLRKKGLAKAAKKSGRIAADGLVGVAVEANFGVVVEVNSETDFVARNDDFQALVRGILARRARQGRRRRRRGGQGRALSGRRHGRRRDRQRHRHDRREHHAAPRAWPACRPWRHRPLRAWRDRRRPRPHRRDRRAGIDGQGRGAGRARAPGRDAYRGGEPARARTPRRSIRRSSRARRAVLADKNAGKPPHVLEKIVESGLKTYYKEVCLLDQAFVHRQRQDGRPGGQGSGKDRRRADRRQGASCATLSARASKSRPKRLKVSKANQGSLRAALFVSKSFWRPNAEASFMAASEAQMSDPVTAEVQPLARPKPLFGRVVVKLSGEALMGGGSFGLDMPTLLRIAADLKAAADLGVQVAVVVGGGNFFRGLEGADKGIERARADSIGMLATVMNALAMEGALEHLGQSARVLSAVAMPSLCQPYSRQAALAHLVKHRVIMLAGGTGNPFFTTDTGAALARRRTLLRRRVQGDAGRRHLHRRPEEGPEGDALRAPDA